MEGLLRAIIYLKVGFFAPAAFYVRLILASEVKDEKAFLRLWWCWLKLFLIHLDQRSIQKLLITHMKALRSGWICGNHKYSQETNNICSKRLEVLDWGDVGDPGCSPHVRLAMVVFSPSTQVINRWYLTGYLASCPWASGFKEAVAVNCTAAHHRHSDKVYYFIFSDSII